MTNFQIFLSAIYIAASFSCKTPALTGKSDHSIDAEKPGYIQYISGNCIEPCPVHFVTIDKNGLMNYEHRPIYGSVEKYFAELNKTQKAKLWEMIDQINWAAVKEDYGTSAEDITPRTLRIFTVNNRKSVLYKHGEPQFITDLGYYIDGIIDKTEWQAFGN